MNAVSRRKFLKIIVVPQAVAGLLLLLSNINFRGDLERAESIRQQHGPST